MFLARSFFLMIMISPLAWSAEIVLGQVAPFSGLLAPTGIAYRAGINLYINSINASGGINGATLKLVSKDDEYKSELTAKLVRQLISESNPVALIGLVGTASVKAVLDDKLLEGVGIPLIGLRSGASIFFGSANPWVFVTRASYADEIAKVLEQYSLTGNSRFAVFYQNDSFGADGLNSVEKLLPKFKGQMVAKGSYEKNTTEVAAAVKAIHAAAPQVVILVANTAASAEFVKQMRVAGNVSLLVALSPTDGPQVVAQIGADYAKGLAVSQIAPAPDKLSIPLIREVVTAYKRFPPPDMKLNHTMVEGYLAAKIVGEGLRKAGANPTRHQLRDALRSFQTKDLGGVFANFAGSSPTGVQFVDVTILDRKGNLLH